MTLFLTSSPCVPNADRAILNPANGFVQQLRCSLPRQINCLFICSHPDSHDFTDSFAQDMGDAFAEAGIPFEDIAVLDGRNAQDASWLISHSDLIILAGGHVPTQNAFLQSIELPELLSGYPGVVMGISAGSMNCAENVYAQPEMEGESIDPDYPLWLSGLGLTDVNILPHYQQSKDYTLDGRRLYEEITLEHSFGNTFYALVDGSYIFCRDSGQQFLCGEAYLLRDGELMQITDEGQVYCL